jgi:hypothetical protein
MTTFLVIDYEYIPNHLVSRVRDYDKICNGDDYTLMDLFQFYENIFWKDSDIFANELNLLNTLVQSLINKIHYLIIFNFSDIALIQSHYHQSYFRKDNPMYYDIRIKEFVDTLYAIRKSESYDDYLAILDLINNVSFDSDCDCFKMNDLCMLIECLVRDYYEFMRQLSITENIDFISYQKKHGKTLGTFLLNYMTMDHIIMKSYNCPNEDFEYVCRKIFNEKCLDQMSGTERITSYLTNFYNLLCPCDHDKLKIHLHLLMKMYSYKKNKVDDIDITSFGNDSEFYIHMDVRDIEILVYYTARKWYETINK